MPSFRRFADATFQSTLTKLDCSTEVSALQKNPKPGYIVNGFVLVF